MTPSCTCPRIATRNGFVHNGYDARCPAHGVPLRPDPRLARYDKEIAARKAAEPVPAFEGVRYCEECGRQHAAVRCDFVDEN